MKALPFVLAVVSAATLSTWQTVAPKTSNPGAVTDPNATAAAAISGVVTDRTTKQPLGGVIVYLGLMGQGPVGRLSQQVTDEHGRFVFDELLPASAYFINASKFGYLDGTYGDSAASSSSRHIVLGEGDWFSRADLDLVKVGAIGGTVVDEFGEPVVGAFVRVLAEVRVGGQRQLAAGPMVTTDDRGAYRIAALPAGRYIVELPTIQNTVPASASPAQIEGLSPEMFARVEAARANGGGSARLTAIDQGHGRLIVGASQLLSSGADHRNRVYPITFFPGAQSIATATTIALGPGEERAGADISLQPVSSTRVSGRIDGAVAAGGLLLRMVPAGLEDLGANSEAATTLVDEGGAFTFLNVPAGVYTIEARQSQFGFTFQPTIPPAPVTMPPTPGRPPGSWMWRGAGLPGAAGSNYSASSRVSGAGVFGRTAVTVSSTDIDNLVLRLAPTLSIRGRYAYEDLQGAGPRTLPRVLIEPAAANWGLGVLTSEEADPIGPSVFSIDGVVPGVYHFRPAPPTGTLVKSITIDGEDYSRKPIDVTNGHDVTEVTVTFTGKIPTLAGIARDAQGQPSARAAVIAFTTDRALWADLGLTPVWTRLTQSSSDGKYTFTSLRAGEYFVVAVDGSRAAQWSEPAFLEKAAAFATRVRLEWGGVVGCDLKLVSW